MNESTIRALVDLRDRQIQKARIQFSNRVSALERADDIEAETDQKALAEKWLAKFDELEKELDKDIKKEVKRYPIYHEMVKVRGIGGLMAAKLIAMIDIERANTISALWRYAGYGVINGEREKPIKGEPLHYNIRMKTTCYLIATSFIKSNSPYREIYDNAKERYIATKPDWSKLRCHNAAIRKMMQMFLSHLWLKWRQLEGLPIREPYAHEYLGHTTIRTPKEFGWED